MKKEYSKPMVMIESFTLTDAIAGSCTIDVGFADAPNTTCKYVEDDWTPPLFNYAPTCEYLWNEDDDKGCYHISTNGAGYFGS